MRNLIKVSLSMLLSFSHKVVSNSLQHRELHAGLPCLSLSPGVCANSCPLSWWCYPTISPSVTSSSCPPASGSFPVSRFFTSGGQGIGASASASVLPIYIQGWFPLGLTGVTSLLSEGLSRVYVSCQWVPTSLRTSSFYMVIHPGSVFILSPNLISCHLHLMPAIMKYCLFLKGSVVWFHSRPLHRLLPLTGTHCPLFAQLMLAFH